MKYQIYTSNNYKEIPKIEKLSKEDLHNIDVAGSVLPFKTNNYLINELIN